LIAGAPLDFTLVAMDQTPNESFRMA
jgi:hypothetical protein